MINAGAVDFFNQILLGKFLDKFRWYPTNQSTGRDFVTDLDESIGGNDGAFTDFRSIHYR